MIPLIKGTYDGKSDKYCVTLKFLIYPTSSTLDLYNFRVSLFGNGKPEEFLLIVRNFNMTLSESGILDTDAKFQ